MSCIRFMTKKGVKDAFLATFDTSQLPGQTLTSVTIEWYVRKRLTDTSPVLIYKTSTDSAQLEVLTPGSPTSPIATVNVYVQPTDTESLHTGWYFWAFKLTTTGGALLTISPPDSHGELAILNSAVVV